MSATLSSRVSARETVEQLLGQEPQSDERRLLMSHILGNIGGLQAGQGRSSEALASFTEAIRASNAVVAAWPSMIQSLVSMGNEYHKLGMLLGDLGRYEEAGEALQKARDVHEVLAQLPGRSRLPRPARRDRPQHRRAAIFSRGHGTEAFEAYSHARECWERLATAHPEQIDIRTCLGGVYCHLGTVEAETFGHPQTGVGWCNRAVEKLVEVLKSVPANAEARKFLARFGIGRARRWLS